MVVAPSDTRALVKEGRARVKAIANGKPGRAVRRPTCSRSASRCRSAAADRWRCRSTWRGRIEDLLDHAELDFVHVHEPFAPSASSAALRHSRALNVGTFHAPTERFLSTQVARPIVERLFGRLDARTASFAATRDLVERFFPGNYTVVPPGRRPGRGHRARTRPPEILFRAAEERGALRTFLRALRKLPLDREWTATVWLRDPAGSTAPPALPRRLRERVRFAGPRDGSEAEHLARATIAVAASSGASTSPAASAQRPRRRRGPGGGALAALRGGRSTTASSGCSSSRATPRCSRRSSSG